MSRGWPAAVLAAVLVLMMAACGAPSDAVPADFTVVEQETFSVAHPDGWERSIGSATQIEAHDPAVEATIPHGLSLQAQDGFTGTFDHVVLLAMGTRRQGEGYALVRDEDAQVDGADQARLVESTWEAGDGEEPVRGRSIDVFARRGEALVFLSVIGEDATWDAEEARAIVASLSLN